MIAAEKTDRVACLVEIAPAYADCTILRFEAAFGIPVVHAETGRSFAETKAERAANGEPS